MVFFFLLVDNSCLGVSDTDLILWFWNVDCFFLEPLCGRGDFCHVCLSFWQIVANSFLANPTTSALFATILVEYLLDRLPEMGSNVELSNLYLKLFKLVFGSVSLFAAENEQMLKVESGPARALCWGFFLLSLFLSTSSWAETGVALYIFKHNNIKWINVYNQLEPSVENTAVLKQSCSWLPADPGWTREQSHSQGLSVVSAPLILHFWSHFLHEPHK